MKEIIKDIRSRLRDAAVKAFGDQLEGVEPTLNEASNATFGDFQSNVALTLSKQLRRANSCRSWLHQFAVDSRLFREADQPSEW